MTGGWARIQSQDYQTPTFTQGSDISQWPELLSSHVWQALGKGLQGSVPQEGPRQSGQQLYHVVKGGVCSVILPG